MMHVQSVIRIKTYPFATILEPTTNRSIQPQDGSAIAGVVVAFAVELLAGLIIIAIIHFWR